MTAMDFAHSAAVATRRSVRLDRCDWDSPCNALGVDVPVVGGSQGAPGPRRLWPPFARAQMNADACDVLDDARTDLDESLADRSELCLRERARLWDRRAHGVHQPEGSSMQHKANLIGRCAMARGAI